MAIERETMPIRPVLVNNVRTELFDDTQPSKMFPMRATLAYLEDNADAYGDDPERVKEGIKRLRAAGVESIPLYKSEAEAAGIVWKEMTEAQPA